MSNEREDASDDEDAAPLAENRIAAQAIYKNQLEKVQLTTLKLVVDPRFWAPIIDVQTELQKLKLGAKKEGNGNAEIPFGMVESTLRRNAATLTSVMLTRIAKLLNNQPLNMECLKNAVNLKKLKLYLTEDEEDDVNDKPQPLLVNVRMIPTANLQELCIDPLLGASKELQLMLDEMPNLLDMCEI